MNKSAFTLIELVFVIVILGILALIAVPKLSATRDDAKLTGELANLSTCIKDAGLSYSATGAMDVNSSACRFLTCFSVSASLGDLSVLQKGDDSAPYCSEAKIEATKNGFVSQSFGGRGITY